MSFPLNFSVCLQLKTLTDIPEKETVQDDKWNTESNIPQKLWLNQSPDGNVGLKERQTCYCCTSDSLICSPGGSLEEAKWIEKILFNL